MIFFLGLVVGWLVGKCFGCGCSRLCVWCVKILVF